MNAYDTWFEILQMKARHEDIHLDGRVKDLIFYKYPNITTDQALEIILSVQRRDN